MKKVLGIVASPRKLGNSEIFIKEISRYIPEEHELKLLRIHDFRLKNCKACYHCLFSGSCVLDDDLPVIQRAMMEADAFIVAVPAYFLGPNSALKQLLDRGLSFYSMKESLWGKPSLGIAVAGVEGKDGYTLLGLNSFLKCIMSDIRQSRVVYSALPGEIVFTGSNRALAKSMGESLFGDAPVEDEFPRCPLCGSDSFRFLGGNIVRCLLCSNTGTFDCRSGGIAFHINKGEHELFLTMGDALKHEEWLKEMKKRFFQELENIKKAREEYKDGEWVRPPLPPRKG